MCVRRCVCMSLILMQLLPQPPMRAVKLNLLISAVSVSDVLDFNSFSMCAQAF